MTAALELVSVSKAYGRIVALDGVSLEIPEGSTFGLIGPNGAGKTTTFGLLSGFLAPTRGEVRVRGARLSPGRPPVGQVAALPQDAGLPSRAVVLDLLVWLARLGGVALAEARARAARALEAVHLSELASRRVGELSHGQRRRIGIAQTILGRDEIVLLDEPTAGLDPRSAAEIRELVVELGRGRTKVLSSHNLQEVEALCDRAAIIDRGRLVVAGTMDELRGTDRVVRVDLARVASDPPSVLDGLRVLPFVTAARFEPEGTRLLIELSRTAERDDGVVNAILGILLERGVVIRGLERGRSLEARFLEATAEGRGDVP